MDEPGVRRLCGCDLDTTGGRKSSKARSKIIYAHVREMRVGALSAPSVPKNLLADESIACLDIVSDFRIA